MNSAINASAPFNLVLSVGTQVVSRVDLKTTAGEFSCFKGAVGVIIQSPTDGSRAYQIRLSNDRVVSLKRHEFSIRKHFQAEGIERSPRNASLPVAIAIITWASPKPNGIC